MFAVPGTISLLCPCSCNQDHPLAAGNMTVALTTDAGALPLAPGVPSSYSCTGSHSQAFASGGHTAYHTYASAQACKGCDSRPASPCTVLRTGSLEPSEDSVSGDTAQASDSEGVDSQAKDVGWGDTQATQLLMA